MAGKDEDSFIKKIEAEFKNIEDNKIKGGKKAGPFPGTKPPKGIACKDTSVKISDSRPKQDSLRHEPKSKITNGSNVASGVTKGKTEHPTGTSGKKVKRFAILISAVILMFVTVKLFSPTHQGQNEPPSIEKKLPSSATSEKVVDAVSKAKTDVDNGTRGVPAQLLASYQEAASKGSRQWNPSDVKVLWLDLNGDGIPDPITHGGNEYCGRCGCSYDIYISKGEDFLATGRIECAGKDIVRTETISNGLYDIVVNGVTTYRFNGKEYIEQSTAPEPKGKKLSEDTAIINEMKKNVKSLLSQR
ncbi:MAG: hypothetical protein AB1499_06490 [Nitrospirota bacterium]